MDCTLTFLGTGTSMGVPTLGCTCSVCVSAVSPEGDSRNRRTRPSISLDFNGKIVLIDTGPDFHAQALRERLTRVDAVFYTHHHADHILGMDDLRPLSFRSPTPIPLFVDENTETVLRRVFHYTFRTEAEGRYVTSARVTLNPLPTHEDGTAAGAEIPLFGAIFQRIPIIHGREIVTGYRFGSAAYLTDMSDIPDASLPYLQDLDILILDALRPEPHPSHSHLAKSISFVEQLKPKRAFFTHMSHELGHAATELALPDHIRLAYDGLQLHFDIAPEDLA
jgi:phosphoribosyl 1,2-cyclic phosphate phosphodiesterase